jgi:hypothetical protein
LLAIRSEQPYYQVYAALFNDHIQELALGKRHLVGMILLASYLALNRLARFKRRCLLFASGKDRPATAGSQNSSLQSNAGKNKQPG